MKRHGFALLGGILVLSSALAAPPDVPAAGVASPAGEPLAAEIRWTRYGIPHVKADDYGGLGYGYGYAYARDHLCLLADRTLTLRGDRSRYLGADGPATVGFIQTSNLNSDLFHRVQLSDETVARASAELSRDALALSRGYAAGVNRYVREREDDPCGAAPVPHLDETDVIRTMLAIGAIWQGHVVAPAAAASARAAGSSGSGAASTAVDGATGLGSNAWAYGADVTGTGSAIVVGNPHSVWRDHWLLMHQLHLTIPGELDVAGADFLGLPLPVVGYTRDVAWSIEAPHGVHYFVLQAMDVTFGNEPVYIVDGAEKPIVFRTVRVAVLENGETLKRHFEIPTTELGALYELPAQGSLPAGWYAITDAGTGNARGIEQLLRVARAGDIDEFAGAVAAHRGIGAHLVAGDRHGNVLYSEGGPLLDLTEKTLERCASPAGNGGRISAGQVIVLDGSRSECAVRTAEGWPRLAPPSSFPDLETRGVIQNTNNSYHLSEFGTRSSGYSPLLPEVSSGPGDARLPMSDTHLREILADDRVTFAEATDVVFSNRNYAAESGLDDVLEVCGEAFVETAVWEACEILRTWDRRNDADSRGALLFDRLWPALTEVPELLAALFDPEQAVADDPNHALAVNEALQRTVESLAATGFTGAEPWGTVLAATAPDGVVPLHGGSPAQGVLNVMSAGPLGAEGFGHVRAGTSYVQVVTWRGRKPQARVMLAHSQSSDPASPHSADQLRLFAEKKLVEVPFEEDAIMSDPELETITIRQPPGAAKGPLGR